MSSGAPPKSSVAHPPHESLAAAFILVAAIQLCSTLVLYALVQRSTLRALLNLDAIPLKSDEQLLVFLSVTGTTLLAALPAAVVGLGLRLLGMKRWLLGYGVALGATLFWLLFDLALYNGLGRHLSDIVRFALLPQGRVAAGEMGPWVGNATLWMILVAALIGTLTFTWRWTIRQVLGRVSPAFGTVIAIASWFLMLSWVGGAPLLQNGWTRRALQERLYGTLAFDPRRSSTPQGVAADPGLARLQQSLSDDYRALFPLLYAAKPLMTASPSAVSGPPPNVILVVTESLRHDVFSDELMPRLHRWAQGGLISERHYASATYSETGMFSLLYGRAPLTYHSTLDAHVPPPIFQALRNLGYECGFFTGHPKIWMRREEFLNDHTVEIYVHDDQGPWFDWDKRAMKRAVDRANSSAGKPFFGVVLLMSTHFDYQYPPEYERHTPVSAGGGWGMTKMSALGPEDRIPYWNRYKNSVASVDDLVADAIQQLDPAKTIVLFTGDHGESIGDDGRFGHGYSFADIIARTPFAAVGAGVPQLRLNELSSHMDLVPTLLHLLGAKPPAHCHGIDLLAPHSPRTEMLLTHATVNREVGEALLLSGDQRLRLQLSLLTPQVTVTGLEDPLGRLLPDQVLPSTQQEALIRSFHAELDRFRQ